MFDEFWRIYPRKQAKKDALKAWNQLSPANKEKALQGIEKQRAYLEAKEPEYRPLPATWLRGERWEDEIEIAAPKLNLTINNVVQIGSAKGIEARPGESMESYLMRVRAA